MLTGMAKPTPLLLSLADWISVVHADELAFAIQERATGVPRVRRPRRFG